MNGRLYDPKLHRFLQPDNFVQDSSNTQNYNRYGYVLNNPLKYTDPSGESFWKSIGKWVKKNLSDIVAGVAIVVGVALLIASEGVLSPWSASLIGSGLAHFGATYAEYTKTGDWNAASNHAGFNFSYTAETDWGYDSKPDGVTQNEPTVTPKSDTDGGGNGGGKGNTNSSDSVYNFYGAKVFIMSEHGSNNWSLFGVIHTSQDFYDGYKTRGLNSYEGLLLMHEYGHYLHSQYAPLNFYGYGMWSSMAKANSLTASSNWTEVKANTMSYYYFHYPSIYDQYKKDYPINPNSISNELKYKLYHHLKL